MMNENDQEVLENKSQNAKYLLPGVKELRHRFGKTSNLMVQSGQCTQDEKQLLDLLGTKQGELERLLEDIRQIHITIQVNANEILELRDKIESLQRDNTKLTRTVEASPIDLQDVDRFLAGNGLPEFGSKSLKELIVKLSIVF